MDCFIFNDLGKDNNIENTGGLAAKIYLIWHFFVNTFQLRLVLSLQSGFILWHLTCLLLQRLDKLLKPFALFELSIAENTDATPLRSFMHGDTVLISSSDYYNVKQVIFLFCCFFSLVWFFLCYL